MFFIQHGFGKSDKIQRLAREGGIAGVILSPANEGRASLANTADVLRELRLHVLLDPQSYIYSPEPQGAAKHHAEHGLDFTAMDWAQSADETIRQVRAVGHANEKLGVGAPFVSPSPFQAAVEDRWLGPALQYARTAGGEFGDAQTIATLAIDETSLASWEGLQVWLDRVTTLPVAGFYLLVNRNRPAYPFTPWGVDSLRNLLRVIYTLTELNQYSLVWGYSDLDGLLGLAAGATGLASGWSYGLRYFSIAKWTEVRTGGAAPVPRVMLNRLWSPLRWDEAESLYESDLQDEVYTEEVAEYFDAHDFDAWNIREAQLFHLRQLADRANEISAIENLQERLDGVAAHLSEAARTWSKVHLSRSIEIDPRYRGKIETYRVAIDEFAEAENL